jgi:DNA repair protein RadC
MKNTVPEIKVSYKSEIIDARVLSGTIATYQFLLNLYDIETIELKEEAFCLYLNRGNRLLGWYKLSSGGIHGTVIDIKLVLGIALKSASTMIILSHNHPSGRLIPSTQDKEITFKLRQAASLMDICLVDHMIVHPSGYFSFAEEGLL